MTSLEDKKRHIVKHEYHDHAFDESPEKSKKPRRGPRGGVTTPFPVKLFNLLQKNMHEDVISWQPHGRCFLLRKPKEFVTDVMPLYFKQSKLTSFQRQLNLYGFSRLTSGPDKGGYYHELFLRGKDQLCTTMIRMRIKGTRTKAASDPDSEPKFYLMPPLAEQPTQTLPPCEIRSSTKSATDKLDKIDSRKRSSSRFLSPQFVMSTPLKDKTEASPVCVSATCSTSSNSRSSSPLPETNIGVPCLPIRMISKTQTIISPRRPNYVQNSIHYYQQPHQVPHQPKSQEGLWHESSRFTDSRSNGDALVFEGKEFHYLDSMSLSFDDDIASSFDTHDTYDGQTGLSIGSDGRFSGFDMFPTYI